MSVRGLADGPDSFGFDCASEKHVADRGKRGYEDLPALALTAFVRDVDVEKASCAGFQKHLAKPVNLAELTKEIAQLANRPPSST